MNDASQKPYTFGRSHRLGSRREFSAVYNAKAKKPSGPLLICTRPNDLGHPRLGLSVSRRVGNAVKRNRIKRLLREAFRLGQYDWPVGYDVVIVVRPHDVHTLDQYQQLLFSGMRSAHQLWQKRAVQTDKAPTDAPQSSSDSLDQTSHAQPPESAT